ncbi:hypothetical protein FACS189490_01000 [Clostridia bacterium]|nr:hypothetical protein FACS189490_01000 [Clostridia bacterium]
MKTFISFIRSLVKATKENELIGCANELTYKLCMAFFPFIIFLMSLLSFLNISYDYFMDDLMKSLPQSVSALTDLVVGEVFDKANAGVLSGSLIAAVVTASSGFNAVIRGITKAYGEKEERNFVTVRIIGFVLVLVLAFAIIASISILIFGDTIYNSLIKNFGISPWLTFILSVSGTLVLMVILLFTIIFIYKFATCKKVTIQETFPGAAITLIVWLGSSKLFNVYVNNFSRYSMVYGSIAGVIILMLWLNIISIVLLIGGEVNALLMPEKERTRGI